MIIREMTNKIKPFATKEVSMVLIVVLVGIASFGLGKLSELENRPNQDLYIEYPAGEASAAKSTEQAPINGENKGEYVGSINGSAYHLPWCPGAQKILPKNEVWFDTIEEAASAGYHPAGNCNGL